MEASPSGNEVEEGRRAEEWSSAEREHMFDKVVTPSDVGKLNRLVIPKQHAEKYFPLDSSSNEKGLLLSFEDRNGKPWRFRYSYWNSSQSYVMTKGWSRFVKEKKLDAGDIVSFQRGLGELGKDRLYIDWRRRPHADAAAAAADPSLPFHPWSHLVMRPLAPSIIPLHRDHLHLPRPLPLNYQYPHRNSTYAPPVYNYYQAATQPQDHHHHHPLVFNSVPVVHGKAAAKRLRLFGVNMECPAPETERDDSITAQQQQQAVISNSAPSSVSQSTSAPPHHRLRLYNGPPLPGMPTIDFFNKGKASMSFDFDV